MNTKTTMTKMKVDASIEAVNARTKFVETGDRKIAYRSIGKGLPQRINNLQKTAD
jgi:hypothetical protein